MKKVLCLPIVAVLYCVVSVANVKATPQLGECEKRILMSHIEDLNEFGLKLEKDFNQECPAPSDGKMTPDLKECKEKFVTEDEDYAKIMEIVEEIYAEREALGISQPIIW